MRFFALLSLCLWLPLQALSNTEIVKMDIKDLGNNFYQVDAHVPVDAPAQQSWDTITDYPSLPQFVESVKVSKLLKKVNNERLLELRGQGDALWFFTIKVNMLLDMKEIPASKKIVFDDKADDDFHSFKGQWTVEDQGPSSVVHFTVVMAPKHTYFGMMQKVITYTVKYMLEDIRNESARRYVAAKTPATIQAPAAAPAATITPATAPVTKGP